MKRRVSPTLFGAPPPPQHVAVATTMTATATRSFGNNFSESGSNGVENDIGRSSSSNSFAVERQQSIFRAISESNEDEIEFTDSNNDKQRDRMSLCAVPVIAGSRPLCCRCFPLLNNQLYYYYYSIVLLAVTTILLFADQNLLAPNLTAIAREFNFTPEERDSKLGGQLALAFFIWGAPVSLLVGCWADTTNHRPLLLALVIFGGEGACFVSYFTRTFTQLFWCRAMTGLSLGGSLPLLYSILGDLFPAHQRHMVSAVLGIGSGLGIGIGQGIAGWFGNGDSWRLPFIYVSVPALICALLVAMTMTDPPRGQMEAATQQQQHRHNTSSNISSNDGSYEGLTLNDKPEILSRSTSLGDGTGYDPLEIANGGEQLQNISQMSFPSAVYASIIQYAQKFRTLFKTPTYVLALMQGSPGCLPWGVVNTFLNDYLSENRGMSVPYATTVITIIGVGTVIGQLLMGGYFGGILYQIDRRWPPLFGGSAAILSCIPTYFLYNHIDNNTPFVIVAIVGVIMGTTASVTGPIVKATLVNVTMPQTRGQAFALFNTFDDFGRGLGPVYVAILIRNLHGRQAAFNVALCGWGICGLLNIGMYFFVVADEDRVQENLLAAAAIAVDNRRHYANNINSDINDDSVGILDRDRVNQGISEQDPRIV